MAFSFISCIFLSFTHTPGFGAFRYIYKLIEKMKLLFLLLLSSACTVTISGQSNKVPSTGKGIVYENRTDILNAPDCNASEAYLKKKVKAQLATFYTEYPYISVDFSSFKGQNGYTDKVNPGKIIYPFKIELLVYLKRSIKKEGKDFIELSTWKYDAVYKYATSPGKKCEFSIVPSSQKTLINRQVY